MGMAPMASAAYYLNDGYSPLDGSALIRSAGNPSHSPGHDFTFSVDKSVSVLWAIADARERAIIEEIVNEAARFAVEQTRVRMCSTTRVRRPGKDGEPGEIEVVPASLIGVQFQHGESREGDPQLHIHFLIPNVAKTHEDGKYRAVNMHPMYQWQKDVHGAEQTIASISSPGKDESLFEIFAGVIQAQKGNFAAALVIADSFDTRDEDGSALRVALLNEIAILQASAGDSLGARQTVESALNTARGSGLARGVETPGSEAERIFRQAVLLSTVAAAQARAGDPQAAKRSFADAAVAFESARNMDPNALLLEPDLSDIAGMQAEAGFTSMAAKTALNIHEERLRVDALMSVVRHLAGKLPLPWWRPRPINFFW